MVGTSGTASVLPRLCMAEKNPLLGFFSLILPERIGSLEIVLITEEKTWSIEVRGE